MWFLATSPPPPLIQRMTYCTFILNNMMLTVKAYKILSQPVMFHKLWMYMDVL